MSKEDIVYHMILNVNRYANVILKRPLRANESHIEWTLMNGYFLEMNGKRCNKLGKIYISSDINKLINFENNF